MYMYIFKYVCFIFPPSKDRILLWIGMICEKKNWQFQRLNKVLTLNKFRRVNFRRDNYTNLHHRMVFPGKI